MVSNLIKHDQHQPPGVTCPCCRRSEMRLGIDRGRPAVACANCGTTARLLQRRGDPLPGYEPRPAGTSEYAFDAPPSGSWWLGMIRHRDQVWRPVALTKEHARCWDALLTYPGEGDRLTVPTDPPQQPDQGGNDGDDPAKGAKP
jgi:hypothetical protein